MSNPFPLSIAKGEDFCNRKAEKERITHNVNNIIHTLLVSPRRYGKTSLALKILQEAELTYAYIDFFMALTPEKIVTRIINGINPTISKLLPKTKRAIRQIEDFFKSLRVGLQLGQANMEFSLTPINQDGAKTIWDLFEGLDQLAQKENKKVIVFMDEFQDIIHTSLCDDIEAAIRHVAQKTSNLIFIFSGSSRHLLSKIFDDKSRPLYKLCDRINLERISRKHYEQFIQTAAKHKWQGALANDVLEQIFSYSKYHPYYVNVICSRLWRQRLIPKVTDVVNTWSQYAEEEFGAVAKELDALTTNQRLILQTIAQLGSVKEPTAQAFLQLVKLAHGSITQAIQSLTQKDYLYKTSNGNITLVDPLTAWVLIQ